MKLKNFFKMIMQHILLPLAYNVNRIRKICEKKVILADAHNNSCPEHMKLIRDRLIAVGYDVEEIYFDVSTIGSKRAFFKMLSFMKHYAQAEAVIICDYFLPVASCKKKKKTKVIQLWHGSGAFKKFGFDSDLDIAKNYRGNPHKNYNLVTVSGRECVKPFMSAMGVGEVDICKVKPIGMSITDKFYDEEYKASCKDKFRYEYPDAAGKKVVLWAPTFRGNAGEASLCCEETIDAIIDRYNGENDIYIVKSVHPHTRDKKENTHMSTHELMACANVLITDYSSVFFDYLLYDEPIIFFAPDYTEYGKNRGFYLDYDNLPGVIIKDCNDERLLYEAILKCTYEDDLSSKRTEFRDAYMGGCDGCATERIIDYVKEKLDL